MRDPWIVWGHHLDAYGEETAVGQPLADLKTHVSITGTTGSGKSTALRNLALQVADLGGTVIVIEPHGDLILHPEEGILAALTDEQLRRTTVVDLAAPWPPQINLAAAGLKAGRSVAVKTAMQCIRVMDDASWSGAIQMRQIMENALALLLATEGDEASLLGLQKFLTSKPYRTQVLARVGQDALEAYDFWDRTLKEWETRKGGGSEIVAVPLRRVGQFLQDERFRRSLSLPALAPELELDIGRLMDDRDARIILVPLQAPKLGEQAKRVFGTLFMQDVTNTFLARSSADQTARRQTLVIIDEFADMAGGDVGELVKVLLAQARKFGASVVLGTQFLSQLPREVQDEVNGNCNNKVVLLAAGQKDAKAAVESLATDRVAPLDVLNIEKYHGYAKLRVDRAPQPPMYFRTLAPLPTLPRGSDGGTESGTASKQGRVRVPRKLEQLNELHRLAAADPHRAAAAIEQLMRLNAYQFETLVKQQVEANHYAAHQLLAHPEMEPDPVQRALQISRAQHGLPWWFYEAQYRKIRTA